MGVEYAVRCGIVAKLDILTALKRCSWNGVGVIELLGRALDQIQWANPVPSEG